MGLTNADIEKIKSIFNDQFLSVIAEKVVFIIEKSFEDKIKKQNEAISQLHNEILSLKNSKASMEQLLEKQEQASRNLNIRIFGIAKEENENLRAKTLEFFNKKLKVNIKDQHIKKCHRVLSKNPGDKPPAILVTFHSDAERKAVLSSRKMLKSTNIQIKEDLTKTRLMLLSAAVNRFSFKNAWCLNGVVYVKCQSGVHRVNNSEELENL